MKKKLVFFLPTAAAVLAVGMLVQSPMPKMLGYLTEDIIFFNKKCPTEQPVILSVALVASSDLLCLRVALSTSRKPASSTSCLAAASGSGGPWGGHTWSREY